MTKSQYEKDQELISLVQFHTDFNREQKNRLMSLIEAETERQNELEISGSKKNVNGYFVMEAQQ